jgi:aminopeptidase N
MRFILCVFALALLATGVAAAPAAAQSDSPRPGAAGVGDRLFPTLGNGGYDAGRYDLSLTYPTSEPEQTVTGQVTMFARATQALSSFNLDFAGDSIESVSVNGDEAAWELDGEELVITPDDPLQDGKRFTTVVHFTSGPFTPAPNDPVPFGWFTTLDGSVTAGQPDLTHTIYPVNDHPVDMARYRIRLDVPAGTDAVASGVLRSTSTRGGRTVSQFRVNQPMASELIQVVVGELEVIRRAPFRGVELRDVAAESCAEQAEPLMSRTRDHMRWMVGQVGAYPFDVYGVLAADQFFLYALETQTLSLHPCLLFDPEVLDPEVAETVMVHEVAHQWYGNSVAPETWSDLWLNEGHATWYEHTYAAEFFGEDFEAFIRDSYANSDEWREEFGPVAAPLSNELFELFSSNVYEGGAVVLYALRQTIGERNFRLLERRWAQEFAGQSVGTHDFIALAERISGQDLSQFERQWLFETTVPPMPGHPDWELDPAEDQAPQQRSLGEGRFRKR